MSILWVNQLLIWICYFLQFVVLIVSWFPIIRFFLNSKVELRLRMCSLKCHVSLKQFVVCFREIHWHISFFFQFSNCKPHSFCWIMEKAYRFSLFIFESFSISWKFQLVLLWHQFQLRLIFIYIFIICCLVLLYYSFLFRHNTLYHYCLMLPFIYFIMFFLNTWTSDTIE